MRKNSLKQKLLHESVFGTWIMTNSLDNAEILLILEQILS